MFEAHRIHQIELWALVITHLASPSLITDNTGHHRTTPDIIGQLDLRSHLLQ